MVPSADPNGEPGGFSAEQAAGVREHLEEVLASGAFVGGKRAQEFLRIVVEHMLAGRSNALKERMIGAEMFGRPVDYDTANDAVVRVKATEVRRRLAQYYLELKKEPKLRIELPVGSYIPKVEWLATGPTHQVSSPAEALELRRTMAEPVHAEAMQMGRARASVAGSRRWILPATGLALLAGIVAYEAAGPRKPPPNPEIKSIAILPLANLSGDSAQEYFADGMTEELISELGRVPALRVISRTSAMTFKGTAKKVPEIARELQVDGVVEGAIGREANRVRINVQLIDARADKQLWTHSYDRDVTSILELQSDVARAIAEEIQIELTPQLQADLKKVRPANPEAVELYLRGVERLSSGSPRQAIDFFRGAIDKDAGYAGAHAALAEAYGWLGEAGGMSYAEAFSQERAEALQAIQLDDMRPEPHLDLGMAAMDQNWDWATQKKEFQRALDLGPSSAAVHWAYANYLSRVGSPNDAVTEGKLALRLDPVSSRAYLNLSFIYYYGRQYDQAFTLIQQAEALHPDPEETRFPSGAIYVEKGEYARGIQEFQEFGDAPHAIGHMGNAYARAGRAAEARAVIPRLLEHVDSSGIGRYEIALVYAGLQDKDKAFEWLEKAYQVRDKGLTYLKVDPCVDPLRSDPRFQSLLHRIGFPAN